MTLLGKLSGNSNKALVAAGITAGLSWYLNGSSSVNLFGMNVPFFVLQGITVGTGVFVMENTKDLILPYTGIHELSQITYIVEPAIAGITSATLLAVLSGGFEIKEFIQDTAIGMGAVAGGHYAQNTFNI